VTLLINEELFDDHEVEPPTTWDELADVGRRIQDAEREAGNVEFSALGLTAGIWNFLPFLYQAGGSLLHADGAPALDTDEAKAAFSFYTGLVREELAFVAHGQEHPYWGTYGGDSVVARFVQGQIAMCFGGHGVYCSLRHDGAPVKAIEPLKKSAGSSRKTVALVRGYALFGGAEKPARPEAMDFLRFLTSRRAMELWIGNSETPPEYMPARESLREDWLEVHPDTEAFVNSVGYLAEHRVSLVSWTKVQGLDQRSANIIGAALQPETSEEQALVYLNDLQQEAEARLQGP
jgi:ABC-type glycerol-3-phosphate transport system substrate-binding protein